eukprot:7932418-Ditylum_brightwellii.AAC.1
MHAAARNKEGGVPDLASKIKHSCRPIGDTSMQTFIYNDYTYAVSNVSSGKVISFCKQQTDNKEPTTRTM